MTKDLPLKQIVAIGGGGFSMEPENPLLDQYILGLVKKERPRVCFVPTAEGDRDSYIVRFYAAFIAIKNWLFCYQCADRNELYY